MSRLPYPELLLVDISVNLFIMDTNLSSTHPSAQCNVGMSMGTESGYSRVSKNMPPYMVWNSQQLLVMGSLIWQLGASTQLASLFSLNSQLPIVTTGKGQIAKSLQMELRVSIIWVEILEKLQRLYFGVHGCMPKRWHPLDQGTSHVFKAVVYHAVYINPNLFSLGEVE